MLYCFDKDLNWDYAIKEMAITKMNRNGILYDHQKKIFLDFDGNMIVLTGYTIFPRTGCSQIYDMIEQIEKQGGISLLSKEDLEKVDRWPEYYELKRKIEIIKGRNLINSNTISRLEETYGKEIFFKTVEKDFSSVIPIELLKDRECAFYKTLEYHLEKEFIISEKVEIIEDKYGKKEYRCVVRNGEIYNISRLTTEVFHEIEEKVLIRLQEILGQVKGVLPKDFVVDLFCYRKNNREYIDVVEFNNIHSSGPFLYNSIMEKSDDLLHKEKRKISRVFVDSFDECSDDGIMIEERNNLYDVPKSFSHDLRNICVTGSIDGWCHDVVVGIDDFKEHGIELKLGIFQVITDDDLLMTEEEQRKDFEEAGLSEEEIKLLKKMLEENKSN